MLAVALTINDQAAFLCFNLFNPGVFQYSKQRKKGIIFSTLGQPNSLFCLHINTCLSCRNKRRSLPDRKIYLICISKNLPLKYKTGVLKKIIALFFLCVFLFTSLGYFVAFKFSQLEIKAEMHSRIMTETPVSRLVCVIVPAEKLNTICWTEDREFSFEGKMYDLVKKEKYADGSVHFYCLNDSKEDELLNKLDENLASQLDAGKNTNSKTGKLILKLLAFDYFSQPASNTIYLESVSCLKQNFILHYLSLSREISSPPPRIV
jgi:hypothetical protein